MTDALVPLNYKDDWRKVEEKGDYAFTEMLGFPVLTMRCPFCNNEAPFPPTLGRVVRKNPLTLVGEVHCSCCDTGFTIRDGVAFGTSDRERLH